MTTGTALKWKLSSHVLLDPANWTQGAPVAGAIAYIGGARSLALRLPPTAKTVGELAISAASVYLWGGALAFAPPTAPNGLAYDINLEKGASLTVAASANLLGRQTLLMGQDGAGGNLRLFGTMSEDFAIIDSGRLTVSGTGHFITGASGMAVGGANGASLVVANGGVVDEGKLGFSQYANGLFIGEGAESGAVAVTGLGSLVSFTAVYVGTNGSATLTISNGAVVQDQVGVLAFNGDAKVLVTGAGSRWDNFSALTVGEVYPTSTTLTVVNYGQIDLGVGGLRLNDTLRLDGSAALGGQFIYDGGEIDALAGHGNVYLNQDIVIRSNWLYNFADVADVFAQKGVALELFGQITGGDTSELRIASGDVIVANAGNAYGFTEIYGGVLEVQATGALGDGALKFSGGDKTFAKVAVEGRTQLSNLIVGFGVTDSIELAGLPFNSTISKTWIENSTNTGGALTLANGERSYTLNFQGAYSAADFRLTADPVLGSLLSLAPHATA